MDSYDEVITELCCFREASDQPYPAKVAVCWVIVNRSKDPENRWPKTLAEVVLEHAQFASFPTKTPPNPNEAANALRFPTRTDPMGWQAWQDCLNAFDTTQGEGATDPTGGCNSYWDSSITTPNWAVGKPVKKIGRLNFVKL